jgi:hypothetical protein
MSDLGFYQMLKSPNISYMAFEGSNTWKKYLQNSFGHGDIKGNI